MGVRHLQTFVQEHVPNGYCKVSLIKECEDFKRNNNNQKPILIIDLFSLIDIFTVDLGELLCGGRYARLQECYEHLIRELSLIAELVFFEDGTLQPQKLIVWKERQNRKYNNCLDVMDHVYANVPLNVLTTIKEPPKVTMHRTIIEETAKKYGKLYKSQIKDCDTEIARYAANNPLVMAVLADDSDFLIYAGNWRYFSIKNMNPFTFETREYNRVALREHLKLTDDQLILLSTLNGNDIIPFEEANRFHESLIGYKYRNCKIRFTALADFIRESSLEHLVQTVSYYMLPRYVRLLPQSVDMYQVNFCYTIENNPLLDFLRIKDYFFVIEIIRGTLQTFTISYFDMRIDCYKNFFQAYGTLLRKQIGIVMHNDRNKNANFYELVTKSSHGSEYQKHDLTPIYADVSLPPLIEWIDRENFPQYDGYRFGLLMWTISNKKFPYLHLITPRYLLDILVLTFLTEYGFISIAEADILLLSIFAVETKMIPDIHVVPPLTLHPRAFQLTFLFTKFHLFIEHSLEVCGLKDLTKMINFDGVLFQNLYQMHQVQPFNIQSTLGNVAAYRAYA